jgi:hypothetical protein
LDEIQTKVLGVFLLAIHSHLDSFALNVLFLQTHATSYSFYTALLYTVKEKGGKSTHPLPYGLRNPYRTLKSENTRLCPETSKKLYVHEFGFWVRSQYPPTEWNLRGNR